MTIFKAKAAKGREAGGTVRRDGEEVMENTKSLAGEVGEICRLAGGDSAA
jgi:hypothetical protein